MRTLIFILFPFFLNAQKVADLKLPDYKQQKTGRIMEFVSYPMFFLSGSTAGMSKTFREIDSADSNRSEFYSVASSVGFVTSAGVWGTGISLQGKPKWSDLYKLVGCVGFSTIGYYTGQHIAKVL